jgi:hypothetical protein
MLFAQCQSDQIAQMVASHYIYLICAIGVLLLGASLQIPSLLLLHKTSLFLSHCVQYHSIHVFIEQKRRVVDRLNNRYDNELDYSIEEPFRGRRAELQLYKPVVLLGGTVGGVVCVSLVFYIVFYFQALLGLAATVKQLPILMNTEASRNLAISEAFLWMRESRDAEGLPRLFPNYSLFPSATLGVISSDQLFHACSSYLLENGFLVSSGHFNELYRSSSLPLSHLHYGWRIGMLQYFQDILACTYDACENMGQLYDLQTQTANNSAAMIKLFAEDIKQEAATELAVILGLLGACSVLLLLVLLCGIVPANQVTYNRAKVLWKLCAILPNAQLHTKLKEVAK